MNRNAIYLFLGCAAIATAGMIASQYLDGCRGGSVRYQALGADICVEVSQVATLRCLETKVSHYDGVLLEEKEGGFDLQLADVKFSPKIGGNSTQGGNAAIASEHLAQAIESCKQLARNEGIKVDVKNSSDTSVNIQVSN